MLPVGDSVRDVRSTPGRGCRPADGQRWSNLSAVDSITQVFIHHLLHSYRVLS